MKHFVNISFLCTLSLIFFITTSYCTGQTESAGENASRSEVQSDAKKESAGKIQCNEKTRTDNEAAPSIFYPVTTYKFKNAVEGKELVHAFTVQNKGDAPLLIQNVRTGWGCATVSYSREIPPGEEGKITIKVNTRGYGGRTLNKAVYIVSNDPGQHNSKLSITGTVEKFASITPRFIRMRGNPENEIHSVVKIIPEKKYPFSITNVSARNGKMIAHTLKNIESKEEKGYLLTVKNLKKTASTYFDLITLTTDSDIQPEIKINVMANLRIPDKAKANKTENTHKNANANTFLELIKKHQQQNASQSKGASGTQTNDPEKAEELEKKFEELIKQAQKKNKTKEAAQ